MASCNVYTAEELINERNADLRAVLREAGKPSYGSKSQLIQRILHHQIKKSDTIQASIDKKLRSIQETESSLVKLRSELVDLELSVTQGQIRTPNESNPQPFSFQVTAPALSVFENHDGAESDHNFFSRPATPENKAASVPNAVPRPISVVNQTSVGFSTSHHNEASHRQQTKPIPKPRVHIYNPVVTGYRSDDLYSQNSLPCINSTPEAQHNGPIDHGTFVYNRYHDSPVAQDPSVRQRAHDVCSHNGSSCNCSIQTALLEKISENISDAHYPIVEPTIFSGDIMVYQEWRKQFMNFINRKKHMSADDKLYHLQKYTGGEAAESVSGYCILKSEQAFVEAMATLDSDYGSTFLAAQAFLRKLNSWPKVSANDPKALKRLTNFLKQCRAAMADISHLTILDSCSENQKILALLPDYLVNKWNDRVTLFMNVNADCYPSFDTFVDFLTTQTKSANNPVSSLTAIRQLSQVSQPNQNKSDPPIPAPRSKPKHAVANNSVEESSDPVKSALCIICKSSNHKYVPQCKSFKAMNHSSRLMAIRDHKLCYRCLGQNHGTKTCSKTWKCGTCGSTTHHSLIHGESKKPKNDETTPQSTCNNTKVTSSRKLFTKIVPVWLSTEEQPNQEFLTYALLDDQSNTTFITNDLASKITAKSEKAPLKISTMTSKNCPVSTRKFFGLRIRGFYCGKTVDMPPTYARQHIPYISSSVPVSEEIQNINHLKHISHLIAPKLDGEVDLLIGRDCVATTSYLEIIEAPQGCASAVRTPVGWCIIGPDINPSPNHGFVDEIGVSNVMISQSIPESSQIHNTDDPVLAQSHVAITLQTEVEELSPHDLMKLISDADFQSSSDSKTLSQDDVKFLNILDKQTYQDQDKYYTMPLPFKSDASKLSNNYQAALTRLEYLKSRFKKDPEYARQYSDFIQGVIDRGEAEKVPEPLIKKRECWYLPHHGVFHKQKGKIRVVFDCSARYNGVSLNDTLLQGPDLNNPLIGVLLRFRKNHVAVSCDIEKMYHRFRVTPNHRDYLRFIWLENDIPVVYRMIVHIFGARSSPNCAKYGLNKLATDYGGNSLAKDFIQSNFYVDDGLCSTKSVTDAIELLNHTRDICANANLHVHKLLSNRPEVLRAFPPCDSAVETDNVNLCCSTERALGVLWSLKSDSFKYEYTASTEPYTRRNMLSALASLYDPMGLISPLILSGRIILQNACRSGYDWDEVLSNDYTEQWSFWNDNMAKLSDLDIQRVVTPPDFSTVKQEIHTFADASLAGYGACSYIRSVDNQDNAHCTLLFGKSRVAPLKVTTIPRLELQAALLAAKQNAMLAEELQIDAKCYLWSDSKIVLGYLNNDERRFHTYVSNRLSQIHDISDKSQWHYVNTKLNPADLASRGIPSVQSLSQSIWFDGPAFLWNSSLSELEASGVEQFDVDQNDPELRKEVVAHDICIDAQDSYLLELCSRFSSWTKAVHTLALVQKVIKHRHEILSKQAVGIHGKVTVDDIQVMSNRIARATQASSFSDEVAYLRSGKTIPKSSSLWKFDCFLDSEGIIRVGGRIKHATVSGVENHPIIMPKKSHISDIIVAHYHKTCGHQGRTTTMGAVRSAGYWIVGLHGLVSSLVYKCVTCRRLRRPTENQKMADLPADRVEVAAPFTHSGCDVFGPYNVQDRRTKIKRYGLIFTCLSSRAVHIEMLDDLTADAFINSLRCFISLRGNVRTLRCDNGTNFVGACNELLNSSKNMICDPRIKEFLLQHKCDFRFNPPESSHFGGTWERMIRSVRNVFSGLSSQINERLDSSSLRTLFYECMAIINSRPLTTVENDVQPLSPNDILHMKSSVILPLPGSFDSDDVYSRKRWVKVQSLSNTFWKRWAKEYLTNLQTRQKWHSKTRNLKVNDIVILSDQCSRLDWPLGKVVKAVPSKDGLVRHVHLLLFDKMAGKHVNLVRPVTKLVLLVES